jgi:hypothetical protein
MATKLILATVMLVVAGFWNSCRVNAPLDPVTMKPSCERCPKNYYHGYSFTCKLCGYGEKSPDRYELDTCCK